MRPFRIVLGAITVMALVAPLGLRAQTPPTKDHAAFVQTLKDVGDARAWLDHNGDSSAQDKDERSAIQQIDIVISDLRGAVRDDQINMAQHGGIDVNLGKTDRFRKALELLEKARHDLNENPDTTPRGLTLQRRALRHIDEASKVVALTIKQTAPH